MSQTGGRRFGEAEGTDSGREKNRSKSAELETTAEQMREGGVGGG